MTRQIRAARRGAGTTAIVAGRPRTPGVARSAAAVFLTLALSLLLATPGFAKVESTDAGIRFSYSDARAREVFVAGSFNNWNASGNAMTLAGGEWSATIQLEAGEYEYKFVVDGQWVADPDNPTTVGEFGNSALNIAADGSIIALQATSNTPLSPKILMGGRAIALYKYRHDDVQKRYELDRPNLDFDIDFNIRVNSDLEAHVLTNVNNDAENVELFETRLNFDRGSLTLDNSDIFLKAWDNEGVADWDDPLALVGRVGIYRHRFGYEKVGALARKSFAGFEAEVLYTDNADPGSGFPGSTPDLTTDHLEFVDGQARLTADQIASYTFFNADGAEDDFAARVSRDLEEWLGRSSRVSLLGRLDRGYSPGKLMLLERDRNDASRTHGTLSLIDESHEAWGGLGGEFQAQVSEHALFRGEYLRGQSWIQVRNGTMAPAELQTTIAGTDTTVVLVVDESRVTPADDVDLDTSNRAFLGVTMLRPILGLDADLSWEFEDHRLAPVASGLGRELESQVSTYRLGLSHEWAELPGLGRPVDAGVGFEYHDFTYDREAPWSTQIWFDDRNFWLERGEHEVSYDRLTLLGGGDVFIWHPRLDVTLQERREIHFSYLGTLGGDDIGTTPKYFESLFQVRGKVTRDWGLYWDSRLVRYDVPALELAKTFFSSFFEVAYEPIEGVSLAVSWGVDPYVIDGPVNEYAYIGRDQFLFAAGANAGAARDDFLKLGDKIRTAETLLEDENRIQFEARLEF